MRTTLRLVRTSTSDWELRAGDEVLLKGYEGDAGEGWMEVCLDDFAQCLRRLNYGVVVKGGDAEDEQD